MKCKKLRPLPDVGAHPANVNSANSRILASMWDDFVNAKERMASEGPFLLANIQKSAGCKVFDACLGTGTDSIFLLENGYAVTSNELDQHFLRKAVDNSRRAQVALSTTSYDWRTLDATITAGSFDAVICLGNSLTYLFQRGEQLRTLHNFHSILKTDGVLIVDTRNYDYLLDDRRSILNGDFRYSGYYVYCGTDKVHAVPTEISDDCVKLEYARASGGKKGHLFLYPFRRRELHDLLKAAGFARISFFSDYRSGLNPNADFHQFVCVRPPDPNPFNPYLP